MPDQGERDFNSLSVMDGARIISYNFSEGERPGGIRIRAKIRIVGGKQAAVLDELLRMASVARLDRSGSAIVAIDRTGQRAINSKGADPD